MGIDRVRFIGKTYEPFICAVCLDVADDPIMTPCEHMFCKACFIPGRCPTCRGQAQRCTGLNRVLREVYGSLRMKCISNACDERFKLENWKTHEESCPKRRCGACGYLIGFNHNCVSICKSKINDLERQVAESTSKMIDLERKVAQLTTERTEGKSKISDLQKKVAQLTTERDKARAEASRPKTFNQTYTFVGCRSSGPQPSFLVQVRNVRFQLPR